MPSYKFYYLSAKGLGEPIRVLLHYKSQKFEDIRVGSVADVEKWRDQLPFGKVPVLELENGVKIPQTLAIATYLAKQLNLNGKDDIEAAHIMSVVLLLSDLHVAMRPFMLVVAGYDQGDAETLVGTVLIPAIEQYMPMFEKLLQESGTGYFAKSGISWADFFICEIVNSMKAMLPDVLGKYKLLNALVDRIYAEPTLQEYLKNRPETKF